MLGRGGSSWCCFSLITVWPLLWLADRLRLLILPRECQRTADRRARPATLQPPQKFVPCVGDSRFHMASSVKLSAAG